MSRVAEICRDRGVPFRCRRYLARLDARAGVRVAYLLHKHGLMNRMPFLGIIAVIGKLRIEPLV